MSQHRLFRILPRWTCVCVYVTVVLQRGTTAVMLFTDAEIAQNISIRCFFPPESENKGFNIERRGLCKLRHYFVSRCPVFLTHTIHSCVIPRCEKDLPACCSCKLPPWLNEGKRDTEGGRNTKREREWWTHIKQAAKTPHQKRVHIPHQFSVCV